MSTLETLVMNTVEAAYVSCFGQTPSDAFLRIKPTDKPEFGDFTSNIAMMAAKELGKNPREIGATLIEAIESADPSGIDRVELAGPGFVNFFLSPTAYQDALSGLLEQGDAYGSLQIGKGKRLQIEFVSSNPTGPLTVGHGRQAVLGDVLATLYERIGFDVHREYYFNDEGRQIDLLAESLWVRYRELFDDVREVPEDGYQGAYLKTVAEDLKRDLVEPFPEFTDETKELFRKEAVSRMTAVIKDDLEHLGIQFDTWFSESTLHHDGKVSDTLKLLQDHEGVFEEEGALWLKAEAYGGAKDSVLIRSDGRPTYLMVDIAYHLDKKTRGFDQVLDVQGADHHAEQTCVKAALRMLAYPDEWLQYAVHQFVSLKEGGQPMKMSTRAGRFVTLRDLTEDLGKDIVRYFMISRKPEAHLDFDLDLARAESLDNPVTYIQYAYTRIRSIFRKTGLEPHALASADRAALVEAEELALIRTLDQFPHIIEHAAVDFAPHALSEYALQLARSFHAYYDKHRVLVDDEALQTARLSLLAGVLQVLGQSLTFLGMETPEEM